MYPTGSCQKYSSSTAGKGTRLKAVKITTGRFAVYYSRPLAWGIVYFVSQCIDTPNFIFAIKQGGLGKTLEVYNSLIAQLTSDLQMI